MNFDDFDALTFDCYGTLIDWESGLWTSLRPVFERAGVRIAQDAALEMFGALEARAEAGAYREYKSVLGAVLEQMGSDLGFTPTADETTRFARSVGEWPAFVDTAPSLQALQRRYKLAIISNVDDDLFAVTARQLGVEFDWVITAQQAGSYKPSLNNFHVAFERMGVPHHRILHVAQSIFHDIVPAKVLGLATVWVNRRRGKSGGGATPAADAQADLEVPDLETLAALTKLTTPPG